MAVSFFESRITDKRHEVRRLGVSPFSHLGQDGNCQDCKGSALFQMTFFDTDTVRVYD